MVRHEFRRFWSALVLMTLLGSVTLPLFGDLHTGLDTACADEGRADFHHDRPQIEIVRLPADDGHCAVCHLQRALSGAADDAKRFVAGTGLFTAEFVYVQNIAHLLVRRDVPSRAPPAVL
jgi:hypothetical protein